MPQPESHADAAATELYVYYRAPTAADESLALAIGAAQRGLEARHPGLRSRLLRRPEPTNGQTTWMETYRHAEGVDAALEAAIDAAAQFALQGLGAGERHVERFVPCVS